jgi:hypothetical protein
MPFCWRRGGDALKEREGDTNVSDIHVEDVIDIYALVSPSMACGNDVKKYCWDPNCIRSDHATVAVAGGAGAGT